MDADFSPNTLTDAVTRAGAIYARYHQELDGRRVAPPSTRACLSALFDGTLDEDGAGLDGALDEFERLVLPHAMGTPHPRYAGLVNSSPLPMAPIADLLVSMLNNNGGAFHQSPAGTSAEREVVRAFAELLGLGAAWGGMFLPGGTYANLQGLLLARARHFPDWERAGPGAVPARPTLYAASSSHFSVARSAQVIGIGGDDVEAVPVVGRGGLDVEALAARVAADRESGRTPFCVVATIGTTGTGAIDDIDRIADVCAEHGLWLHVDACYGGAIALCDELRDRLRGIERGDSVVVDSHKWFFMPITAGLLLTPHRDVEAACFRVDAPYIPGDGEIDAFRRGIPTSRRGQGLAVWLTLRAHGFAPIRAAVRRNIAQMRSLERRLAASGFRVLPGGELSICCARYEPDGRSPGELDALQVRIAEDVVARGIAWFATTRHAGLTWLRFNTVNLHTRDRHVEQIADAVIASASRLTEPRMHSP